MGKVAKRKIPTFKTSGFAILDVTTGRKALAKYTDKGGKVRATIDVIIDYVGSNDDGTSVEFVCSVATLKNVRAA